MDQEYIFGKMGKNMKENLKKIKGKEKELNIIIMEIDMKEIIKIAKKKEKE